MAVLMYSSTRTRRIVVSTLGKLCADGERALCLNEKHGRPGVSLTLPAMVARKKLPCLVLEPLTSTREVLDDPNRFV